MRIATRLGLVAAGVFVTFGVTGLLAAYHLREVAEATTAAQAKNVARTIAGMATYEALASASGPTEQDVYRHLQGIVNFTAAMSKYDVEIFDARKMTIADIDQSDIGKEIEPERALPLTMTLKDGMARTYRLVNAEFPDGTRQAVVPVRNVRQEIVAALVLDYTPLYNESMEVARSSLESVVGLTLGALLLSIAGGLLVARNISRPIERLRNAAAALAAGRKGVAVDVGSSGEIGELGQAFNVMARTLEANQTILEARARELAEANESLTYQANYDALTGLANRNLLMDRLGQAIVNSSRRGDKIALLFIDLDGFKLINDNLGHDAGDELLKLVAARLTACVRESDTVARLGGDEFVLLLLNQSGDELRTGREHNVPRASAEAHITLLTQKLLTAIDQPMLIAGHNVRVSGSIGVSLYPQDGPDAETLLKNADIALYRAKELGRNGFQFFTGDLHQRVRLQMELGTSLRLALEREEFELHYQPQVSLRSGKIVGVETLLRWRHPEKGLIGPGSFIDFAEQSGLILPMGEWIMMRACAQNKAWQEAGLPAFPVAVNVSAKQCAQQDLVGIVKRALSESGLKAEYLEIELTESLSMADPEKSVPLMNRLKEIGVKLAIDDFGTGYSNMSYLKRFPIDRLKLDISFVREITTDAGSLAISDAIITMSHSLGLEVVAEGVETEGQLELLKARHCDLIQGFYFSPGVPADKIAAILKEDRRLPSGLTGRSPDAPAILALDDDPHVLTLLELNLRPEGYALLFCNNADQAFEMLARHEVAVVLCDQRMPGMAGVDFLAAVRSMYPETVRILLSAYEDFHVTREAINAGAVYKFIEKPWSRNELLHIVDDAFAGYQNRRKMRADADLMP